MTNFNIMCFEREEDTERMIRAAKCLCAKCREKRSKIKTSPEELKSERREKAREIVRNWYK